MFGSTASQAPVNSIRSTAVYKTKNTYFFPSWSLTYLLSANCQGQNPRITIKTVFLHALVNRIKYGTFLNISFPRNIILLPRNIISFPRNKISFPRNIISFRRNIISFHRNNNSFPRNNNLHFRWLGQTVHELFFYPMQYSKVLNVILTRC